MLHSTLLISYIVITSKMSSDPVPFSRREVPLKPPVPPVQGRSLDLPAAGLPGRVFAGLQGAPLFPHLNLPRHQPGDPFCTRNLKSRKKSHQLGVVWSGEEIHGS